MPSYDLEYPKQPFSTVNRYNQRAVYALETIHSIINSALFVHVSFTVPNSPFPMVIPMIGQMGSFDRPSADTGDVLDLYLHGYISARLMNRSREGGGEGEAAGQEKEEQGSSEGRGSLPVSVAASHVDGLVLSLTPNSHDYNYRSAVLFGHASVVADPAERLWAMEHITDSVVRDRWRHTRVPPSKGELASTGILKVKVAAGSAKVRTGMPADAKGDVEDADLVARVWQGVVPVHTTLGEPIPGPLNAVGDVPQHVRDYVAGFNEDAMSGPLEAAKEKGK